MDTLVQQQQAMVRVWGVDCVCEKSPKNKLQGCVCICVHVFRAWRKNINACIGHVFAHAWNRFPQKKKNGRMVMCRGLCVYMCSHPVLRTVCVLVYVCGGQTGCISIQH